MALFSAAAKGDVLKIQSLIDSEDKSEDSGGVDVNCTDTSGKTPLHIASENGHLETVKCLTHHGAKLNVIDSNLQTSVHLCSKKGHLHVVELLVNEGADIDVGDKDGFTALHIASSEGHLDIVKYLVRKGAQLDKCDKTDRTPLSCASQEGHLEVVEYIVNKGAGTEAGEKDGVTALHIASLKGHLDIVKYLARKGADLGRFATDYCTSSRLYKATITKYIDHFSERWIISLIRRYFIGKRLICTPYVPLSTSRDMMNSILLIIKDDFCGVKEDTIPDFKVAFQSGQYCVYWGHGPLLVRHLENQDEVSTQELEECAFFDMNTHTMPFILQPREKRVPGVLVTLILKQKITKRIAFQVLYNDVPHENPIAQSKPIESASSKGKAEPTDVGRGTSKSSQFSEELMRSEHHLETIDPTSPESADTKASTSSTVSVHSLESAAEGTMGVLAPQEFGANIVQELVPGFSADQIPQRSGNVNIYVREMVIHNPQGNNPQGNTVAPTPVAIASIAPPMLQHELSCRLNRESPVFADWRGLAVQLGLEEYIKSLEQCKNPTEELLVLAESQKKIQNLGDLGKAFERMNRGDCQELCENYAFERTKSADPRKDQMEDDDTDSSD